MAASRSRRLVGMGVLAAFVLLAVAPLAGASDWSQYGATVTHSFDSGATPPAALGLIWSQATNVAANATAAITGTLAAPAGNVQYVFHADLDGRSPANLFLRKMAIDNGSFAASIQGWGLPVTATALSSLASPDLAGPPRTLALSGTRLYGLVTAKNATEAQDVLFSLDVGGNATDALASLDVFRTAPWAATSQGPARSAPAIGEGYIVFGSNDGNVTALWEGNFTLAWRYDTGTPVVTVPSVYGNFVYVTAGTSLYFLDLFGRMVFQVPAGATVTASPVVTATYVFLDAGGVLSAVNRSTGPPAVWSQPTGSASVGTPALAGSSVLARRTDGRVFAFDQATGRIDWVRPGFPAPTDGEDFAIAGGRAFLSAASDLVALNTTNGALVYDNATESRPALGSPVAAGSVVLVTEGSRLLAYRGQPDLLVLASDIVFNPKAIEGQFVLGNFSVTVRNGGDEPAAGVVVRVSDGTWWANLTVAKPIKPAGRAIVDTPDRAWSVGKHVITVYADALPTEADAANNGATAVVPIVAGPSPPPEVVGAGPYWVALLLGFGVGALVLYLPLRRLREVRRRGTEPESPPASEKV